MMSAPADAGRAAPGTPLARVGPRLAVLFLATTLPLAAADAGRADGPAVEAVRGVYEADYEVAEIDLHYSERLLLLFEAEEEVARREGIGRLDFDWRINGQDVCDDYTGAVDYALLRAAEEAAEVAVDFRNCGDQRLIFELTREGGEWLVDDVASLTEPEWRLSDILAGP